MITFVELKKKKNFWELRNTASSLNQDSKCPGEEPKRGYRGYKLAISAFDYWRTGRQVSKIGISIDD
jgi:hypothetical protein